MSMRMMIVLLATCSTIVSASDCCECALRTSQPSHAPTYSPTPRPTQNPTAQPTTAPSIAPTRTPTPAPSRIPTGYPTHAPTSICDAGKCDQYSSGLTTQCLDKSSTNYESILKGKFGRIGGNQVRCTELSILLHLRKRLRNGFYGKRKF